MRHPLLTFMTLLLAFNVFAAEPASKTLAKPSEPSAKTISKKAWVQAMHDNLPGRLCDSEEYFMQCYTATAKECLSLTTMVVDGCLKSASINLPDNVTAEEAEKWGKMVARCSFELYTQNMAKQKRDLPECQSKADTAKKSASDKKSASKVVPQKKETASEKGQ